MFVFGHAIISGLLGLILSLVSTPVHGLVAFFAGIMVDLDHLIDLLFEPKTKDVVSFVVFGKGFCRPRLVDLLLHSWEPILILLALNYRFSFLIVAGLVGYSLHLLTDTIFNHLRYGTSLLICFFSYRVFRHGDRLREYSRRLAIRDFVLKRDNFRCVVCGERGKTEVHMEKFAMGDETADDYITLCHKCHLKKHFPSLALSTLSKLGILVEG